MGIFRNFKNISVNFSNTLGATIYNESGKKFGQLCDFFVDYEEVYPLVIAIQYKRNRQHFYISWENIVEFNYEKIIIKDSSFIGRSRTFPKATTQKVITSLLANQFTGETVEYPPLGKIVLDRQIVDTAGKKVVRVNDIQLIKAGQNLRVTHAAIGIRSMIRRLGFERAIDKLVSTFNSKSKYLTSDSLINWKYVHAIPNRSIQSSVKLNLSNEDIKGLHPADLADILEDLDSHGRELIFSNLDPKLAAETLSEVEDDVQVNLLKNETPETAAKIIEQMDTDDAADLLHELGDKRAESIISQISDEEIVEEIHELLEYDDDTAGGLMSTEVFEVSATMKQNDILEKIKNEHEEIESIYDLYITNLNGKLLGTCSLKDLLIQKDNIEIGEIMNKSDIKSLSPNKNWREVAKFMSKYNLINAPVINAEQELLGIISVDDLLPWLLDE
jgi:sporulation protein YlmC with PRC-barrel domain